MLVYDVAVCMPSAVTPITYLQHTANTNQTFVNNALIMHLRN